MSQHPQIASFLDIGIVYDLFLSIFMEGVLLSEMTYLLTIIKLIYSFLIRISLSPNPPYGDNTVRL